jgi:CubicO group peptidase (beta-lactamase class C family)
MKDKQISPFAVSCLTALLCVACAHQTHAQQPEKAPGLPGNSSETLGFSSGRLDRLHAAMQREVDQKELAGVVTLLARHGKVVEERAYGKKDIAEPRP